MPNSTPVTVLDPAGVNELKINSDGSINVDIGSEPTITIGRIQIQDPVTSTQLANVKAASTAAGATDYALVVSLSPNSPIPTGANLIGSTDTCGRVDVTPTVQAAQYVSGNCIGGLVSFTMPRTATGLLQSFGIQFIGGATTGINCYFFDANPTGSTFTDKSTFTIAAADEAKRINKTGFTLSPAAATGDAVTASSYDNYAKPFNATGTIYGAFCVTGTFTPASSTDLRVNITFVQEAL